MRWFTTCLISHFLTSITTPAPKSSPSSYFVDLAPLHRLLSFPSPHPHYTLPSFRHQETFVSYFTNTGRYQDLPALATISLNDNVHLRARGFHSDLHSCYNHCRYPNHKDHLHSEGRSLKRHGLRLRCRCMPEHWTTSCH